MNKPQSANPLAITRTDIDTFYADDTSIRKKKSTGIFTRVLVLLLIYTAAE